MSDDAFAPTMPETTDPALATEPAADPAVESAKPEPTATGTAPVESAAPVEAPVSDIDDEVLGIAETLGLPRSAAQGFENRAALVGYLSKLTTPQAQQPAQAAPAAPNAPAPPPNATPAEKAAFKKFEHMDFDEQFVSDLNAQMEALHGRFGEKSSSNDTINALRQQIELITHHLVLGTIDGLINTHGEQYADVLGKGPTSGLAQGSPQHDARVKQLLPRMRALQASFEQMNLPAQSEEALFRAAVGLEFGARTAAQARDDVQKQVDERTAQGLRRPAGQANRTPDPSQTVRERAAAAQERILASSTLTDDELRDRAAQF